MDFDKLRADLAALLNDQSLLEPHRILARRAALDLIRYAEEALHFPHQPGIDTVFQQAAALKPQLEAVNQQLFRQVRADLVAGQYTPTELRTFLNQFTDYAPWQHGQPEYEYDGLDILLEQVFFPTPPPAESRPRLPGMIRYEATPARVILELIDHLQFTPQDVFVDLGSGLGLVVMLVNLLTGTAARGVEFDPVYCEYAQARAAELHLPNVTFTNADARATDLNDGTIFYLFTPFVSEVFDGVLERLRYVSLRHPIYVCSYGTITYDLAKIRWLQLRDPAMEDDFKLAIFTNK